MMVIGNVQSLMMTKSIIEMHSATTNYGKNVCYAMRRKKICNIICKSFVSLIYSLSIYTYCKLK